MQFPECKKTCPTPGWCGSCTNRLPHYERLLAALAEQLETEADLPVDFYLGNLFPFIAIAQELGLEAGPDNIGDLIEEAKKFDRNQVF